LLRGPCKPAFLRPNGPIFLRAERQKTERNLLSNPRDNSVSHLPSIQLLAFRSISVSQRNVKSRHPYYQLNNTAPIGTVNHPCLNSMV